MNSVIGLAERSCSAVKSSAQAGTGKAPALECLVIGPVSKATAHDREILRDEDRLLRLKTVAAETDVSEKTVRRWIDLRGLRSQKLGGLRVVRKRDLMAFLDQQGTTRK